MDWFKTVMLILGVASAIACPIYLAKAIRRRDGGRVFDGIVTAAVMVLLFSETFWPGRIHAAGPVVRWLAVAVAVLFVANWFGFGQWLFRPKVNPEPPPA